MHLPEDEADKKRLLYFLVQATVADGKIGPKERKILDTVIDKMGMSGIDVEKFLQLRLKEMKSAMYTVSNGPSMVCPKCGHDQPKAYRCRRCGIIFEKYKQIKGPSDTEKIMDMLASSNVIKKKDDPDQH